MTLIEQKADELREAEIRLAAAHAELEFARGNRDAAQRHVREMCRLINSRSAEQVRRMEASRGLL